MNYCLDSWAVIAWMNGQEPSAAIVESVISERPFLSVVNATEVYYITRRRHGELEAQRIINTLRVLTRFVPVDEPLAILAGVIKSMHPMSLGDSYCAATAIQKQAQVLTGDPELMVVNSEWKVRDIRKN
jgi:PIN domain nuclease of toxin-antitoxin system